VDPDAAYRILIFDDDKSIREILWHFFDHKGYEVFTFPHPRSCPINDISSCTCPLTESCADFIITDLNMPFLRGIDFIEQQISKGCKVKNLALMTGDPGDPARERAEKFGVKVFTKPFRLADVEKWITDSEVKIPMNRKLSDWHLKRL
jgi:DNA-binding NtrC family response regulator